MSKHKLKYLIAGPCSAESEEELIATANELAKINEVSMFRAGVWKPRTNPNSFEGVGDIGLKWLERVKEETGLKVITEVANTSQVEKCLAHNIDAIWIGTRTTVNPFYVQEIANSLKGVNIPVFIKNPIIPDISVWGGAIERFKKNEIKDIVAVHRGFYTNYNSKYRNEPLWDIPQKLAIEHPEVDVICDPSHIAGSSNLIEEISFNAIFNNAKGLMIETHLSPKDALSDKEQQITPEQLKLLVSKINNTDFDTRNNSLLLKQQLKKADEETLYILAKRFQIVKKLIEENQENPLTLYTLAEWKKLLKEFKKHSKTLNLDQDFIKKIVNIIHSES